jgi:hypothetical protein
METKKRKADGIVRDVGCEWLNKLLHSVLVNSLLARITCGRPGGADDRQHRKRLELSESKKKTRRRGSCGGLRRATAGETRI